MSQADNEIRKKIGNTDVKRTAGDQNPYIKPKHRAIFERMKQGETITGAMIAMSYAPRTVNEPRMITKSKSWALLMAEQLPEDVVAERHRELLDARKYRTVVTGRGKARKEERVDDGADPIVMKAVELAYKLRGRTKDEPPPADRPNVYNLFYQQNVQASVRAFEDTLKQAITHELIRPTDEVEDSTQDQEAHEYIPDDSRSVDSRGLAETSEPQGSGADDHEPR